MTSYRVEVKAIDGYTTHSTHESHRDAVDQADMVHGRVVCQSEGVVIEGIAIQHDKSGVGHCWVAADNDNCPPSIQEEIAAEIIDGGNDDCDDYVASNGCHYRW